MAQQTAVEWLDRWFRDNPEATHEEGYKALEQAKQMEKEQIMDAIVNNQNGLLRRKTVLEAEQYYNETYGE
jgi:hypothetical protein